MKRFYEDHGDYWVIKRGVIGFVMLRLTKFPDLFFRTWFSAVPGFCLGGVLGGFLANFSPLWAEVQLTLLVSIIPLLSFISLWETTDLFNHLRKEGHLKAVRKGKDP